jgi:hypothetical protein
LAAVPGAQDNLGSTSRFGTVTGARHIYPRSSSSAWASGPACSARSARSAVSRSRRLVALRRGAGVIPPLATARRQDAPCTILKVVGIVNSAWSRFCSPPRHAAPIMVQGQWLASCTVVVVPNKPLQSSCTSPLGCAYRVKWGPPPCLRCYRWRHGGQIMPRALLCA